jgi:hypothetical protein
MVKTYGPLGRYNRLGNPVPVLHVQSEGVYGVQTIDAVVPMSEQ